MFNVTAKTITRVLLSLTVLLLMTTVVFIASHYSMGVPSETTVTTFVYATLVIPPWVYIALKRVSVPEKEQEVETVETDN